MAFSLLFLSISSLLFTASAFPFLEPPPLPLPEANPELPASPVSAPTASPAAGIQNQQPVGQQQQNPVLPATPGLAAASPVAAPVGGANQQPSGGPEQDQQQPLDGSVSGGSTDQEPEPEQGNLQPTGAGAGVQPVGFGQAGQQQQQAVGFGAQPLVDNTPFDSGSSRMGMGSSWSWFGCAYALASAWFIIMA